MTLGRETFQLSTSSSPSLSSCLAQAILPLNTSNFSFSFGKLSYEWLLLRWNSSSQVNRNLLMEFWWIDEFLRMDSWHFQMETGSVLKYIPEELYEGHEQVFAHKNCHRYHISVILIIRDSSEMFSLISKIPSMDYYRRRTNIKKTIFVSIECFKYAQ